jgi:hypothetical protein
MIVAELDLLHDPDINVLIFELCFPGFEPFGILETNRDRGTPLKYGLTGKPSSEHYGHNRNEPD